MSDPQAPPADTVAPARVAPAGVAPAGVAPVGVPSLLHALLSARGPSGYEGAPAGEMWSVVTLSPSTASARAPRTSSIGGGSDGMSWK